MGQQGDTVASQKAASNTKSPPSLPQLMPYSSTLLQTPTPTTPAPNPSANHSISAYLDKALHHLHISLWCSQHEGSGIVLEAAASHACMDRRVLPGCLLQHHNTERASHQRANQMHKHRAHTTCDCKEMRASVRAIRIPSVAQQYRGDKRSILQYCHTGCAQDRYCSES